MTLTRVRACQDLTGRCRMILTTFRRVCIPLGGIDMSRGLSGPPEGSRPPQTRRPVRDPRPRRRQTLRSRLRNTLTATEATRPHSAPVMATLRRHHARSPSIPCIQRRAHGASVACARRPVPPARSFPGAPLARRTARGARSARDHRPPGRVPQLDLGGADGRKRGTPPAHAAAPGTTHLRESRRTAG